MINLKHGDAIKAAKLSKAYLLSTARRGATAHDVEAEAIHVRAVKHGHETAYCTNAATCLSSDKGFYEQEALKQAELESRAIEIQHGELYLIEGEILKAVVHGDKFSDCVVFRRTS